MRIVLVSSLSIEGGGGVGRVVGELAEAIAKKGNEVLLVLPSIKSEKRKLPSGLSTFNVPGRLSGDVVLPNLDSAKVLSVFKTLRKFKPDIIHFHDQGHISFLVLLWALKNKIPAVFTSHAIPSKVASFGLNEVFPKIQPLVDSKIFKNYLDLFLKKSSAIVAINDSVLKDLANFNFETPVYKITNGRHLSLYSNVSYANIVSFPKRLLYVGYLNKRKNQSYLLDVMKYLPKEEFVLDLIGVPLDASYGHWLKEKARSLDVSVRFLGKVPHEEIPRYLSLTHFFVSASLLEVQSLSVLEALASGTPVISLNNETTSEFIDNSVGYNFVVPTPPEDFASNVVNLSKLSVADYEKMCGKTREKVRDLDWSNILTQTLAMYKEVLISKDKTQRRLNGLKKLLKYIDITA